MFVCFHPFPGLVFEERFDDGVHGVNVPRLIHKVDSSKTSGKTVLRRRRDETDVLFSDIKSPTPDV